MRAGTSASKSPTQPSSKNWSKCTWISTRRTAHRGFRRSGRTLLGSDCLNVVARHGNSAIGHATLVPDSGEAYELAIFVLHTHQGAGIGTVLLKRLLGHARASGIELVWLTVERWNKPAITLYEKVGFETASTEGFELEMGIRL